MRHLAIGIRRSVIGLLLVALAGCGCGGGDGERGGAPPMYDLTGVWKPAEPVECTGALDAGDPGVVALYANQLDEFLDQYEVFLLDLTGFQVTQDGNDLTLLNLDTGREHKGTIDGDTVRYEYSFDGEFELAGTSFGYQGHAEVDGTILSTDQGMVIEMLDAVVTVLGSTVDASLTCHYDARRIE